jgi:glutamate N-acetyltransferase/amino-acid N-acetyltransferase
MANGAAGNSEIVTTGADYEAFRIALRHICVCLARMMAADGEGAKHLITCIVRRAASEEKAEIVGKSIIRSPLVKTAIFGEDANWGRILCAAGYSGVEMDPEKCSVAFMSEAGSITVCEKGRGLLFDEDTAKKILAQKEITIDFDMDEGKSEVTCWGCDLSYDYVKINGDYRT